MGIKQYFEVLLVFQVVRVFAIGPEDLGSIPGRVIPKTLKMVLDTSLLNTQQYKGKVEQFREWSSALPLLWSSDKTDGRTIQTTGDRLTSLY